MPATPGALITKLSRVWRAVVQFLHAAGRVVTVGLPSAGIAALRPDLWGAVATHALRTARRSVWPVVLLTAPVGAMLALQSLTLVRQFDVERLLAPVVVTTIVREIAPGFASLMIAMQAGAGIATELGAMRVREELDAVAVMGLDPRALVVGPRVLGALLAGPIVNVPAVLAGVGGAWAMSVGVSHLPNHLFMQHLTQGLTPEDIWLSQVKCAIFGLLLGAISATFGFDTRGGPFGVGKAANRAVVASVVCIVSFNYLVNTAVYGLRGGGVLL